MVRNTPLPCPHCGNHRPVIKHGTTRAGTQRYRCLDCKKAFAPQQKSRRVSQETELAIERALAERIAKNAIKRTFRVGWDTIARIEKRGRSNPPVP